MPTRIDFAELKAGVSIVDVLGHYGISLRQVGDELVGVCPIHQGSNPGQFRASITKNCWHCFGDCGRGGSVIDLVALLEGVEVREAAELLSSMSLGGIPPAPSARPRPAENAPLSFRLALDADHPYLAKRGLVPRVVQDFGLGYCGHGLLAGRIAIPIGNARGELVAYAGRFPGVPPDETPKYLLPRSFRKSLEVFNLHRARWLSGPLVVVEGFFDAVWLVQAGFPRSVAIMGSRLSAAQERLLVEAVGPEEEIVLLFDEDDAGRRGREDAHRRLSRSVSVRVVELSQDGMQPDGVAPTELRRLLDL